MTTSGLDQHDGRGRDSVERHPADLDALDASQTSGKSRRGPVRSLLAALGLRLIIDLLLWLLPLLAAPLVGILNTVLQLSDEVYVLAVAVLVSISGALLGARIGSRRTFARLLAQPSSGTLFSETARALHRKLTRPIGQRSIESILRDLKWLFARRRHPLDILEEDVTSIVAHYRTQSVKDPRPWIAAYFAGAFHLSEAQRGRTVNQIERKLAAVATMADHAFVTYGESRLVTEGLRRLAEIVRPSGGRLQIVTIVDDGDSGFDWPLGLGERFGRGVDVHAMSCGDFVNLVGGHPSARPKLASVSAFDLLIGCERIEPVGATVIASAPGREAAVIDRIVQLSRRTPRPKVDLHLVSESYKVRHVGIEGTATFAATTFVPSLKYVISGVEPRPVAADLIRLGLRNFDQLITDKGALPVRDVDDESLQAELERLNEWGDWLLPRSAPGDWQLVLERFDGITHVMFGIDALVESRVVDYGAFASVLAPFHTLTEAEYDGIFDERTDEAGLRALIYSLSEPDRRAELPKLLADKNRLMHDRTLGWPRPLPARDGALPLLRELRRSGREVWVLAAYGGADANMVLTVVGLDQYVGPNQVYCAEDDKSSEFKFRQILADWKAPAERCLLIDDSETTRALAERVGWKVIAVSETSPLTDLLTRRT